MVAEYRSFGKFSAVYDDPIERIYSCVPVDRARQTEKVLRAYVEHASEIGTCYPGVDRIMEKTHYSETTVKRALVVLGELDYMRVHHEYVRARRKDMYTFQISPYVMWIKPECIDEAVSLWNSTSLRCNVIINGQPAESESESEPSVKTSNKNQHQNQHHHQNTHPEGETKILQFGQQRNAPESLREASDQHEVPETENQHEVPESQRNAPVPTVQKSVPPRPDLRKCKSPLPDTREEQLAQELQGDVNTRISQARQLVLWFGYASVRDGMNWLKEERKNNREIKSEFGLLQWWLKNGAILENEKPNSPNHRYHDFFER